MPRIAYWDFNETTATEAVSDEELSDGTAQDGTYLSGASPDGSGAANFDGVDDYIEVPYDSAFALSEGTIVMTVTQNSASVSDIPHGTTPAQTIFSMDSNGFDTGGHLTIFIQSDGTIAVRHQTDTTTYQFAGGAATLGEPVTIAYSWGPSGGQLIVDGVAIITHTQPLTLEGNTEPLVFGANQTASSDGAADNLKGFFDGTISNVALYDEVLSAGGVPCFARGTKLLTPSGLIPVEDLQQGDLVTTCGSGDKPIRWIGSFTTDTAITGGGDARLFPIRIKAGALGAGLPCADLLVSRQHRIEITSKVAQRMFKRRSALVPAHMLTRLPGIYEDCSVRTVEYHHLLFDTHEVVYAEGVPTESLLLGGETWRALPERSRREIAALDAPQLAASSQHLIPPRRQQKRLIARHLENDKPLY
ncbi:Hint domain-containing protein [Aliishimia ponticola]|nr:Hint domain-containing protein [Aliishimia ponticola]